LGKKFTAVGPNISAKRNYWGSDRPIRGVLFNDSTRVTTIWDSSLANIDSAGAHKIVSDNAYFPFILADSYESSNNWSSAASIYQNILSKGTDPGEKRLALKSHLKL
jgi:hypothetical protein